MDIHLFIKGKNGRAIVCSEAGIVSDIDYPDYTNNQCEWEALYDALVFIDQRKNIDDNYIVHIDSKLLLSQIVGKINSSNIISAVEFKSQRIKSRNLKSLYLLWNDIKNKLSHININYKYSLPLNNIARLWFK